MNTEYACGGEEQVKGTDGMNYCSAGRMGCPYLDLHQGSSIVSSPTTGRRRMHRCTADESTVRGMLSELEVMRTGE